MLKYYIVAMPADCKPEDCNEHLCPKCEYCHIRPLSKAILFNLPETPSAIKKVFPHLPTTTELKAMQDEDDMNQKLRREGKYPFLKRGDIFEIEGNEFIAIYAGKENYIAADGSPAPTVYKVVAQSIPEGIKKTFNQQYVMGEECHEFVRPTGYANIIDGIKLTQIRRFK